MTMLFFCIMAMNTSHKIVELARQQYAELNPQPTWMATQPTLDQQSENLFDDGDHYEVDSECASEHSDHNTDTEESDRDDENDYS